MSVLRAGSRRWPPKYQTLNEAYVGQKINSKTGREAKHYLCATCCGEFPSKDVQVDHIDPVVPASGFVSWDSTIERLFCSKDNMQVLCSVCHKLKGSEERQQRNVKKNSL